MKIVNTNDIFFKIFQMEDCSQTEFGRRVGLSHTSNISAWLSGEVLISHRKLLDICEKLGHEIELSINFKTKK